MNSLPQRTEAVPSCRNLNAPQPQASPPCVRRQRMWLRNLCCFHCTVRSSPPGWSRPCSLCSPDKLPDNASEHHAHAPTQFLCRFNPSPMAPLFHVCNTFYLPQFCKFFGAPAQDANDTAGGRMLRPTWMRRLQLAPVRPYEVEDSCRGHLHITTRRYKASRRPATEVAQRLCSPRSCRGASLPKAGDNGICQGSSWGLKGNSRQYGSEEGVCEEGQGPCAPSQGEHPSVASCFENWAPACAMHVAEPLPCSALSFLPFCSRSLWRMRRKSQQ